MINCYENAIIIKKNYKKEYKLRYVCLEVLFICSNCRTSLYVICPKEWYKGSNFKKNAYNQCNKMHMTCNNKQNNPGMSFKKIMKLSDILRNLSIPL